jgi:uncharacterized repeat protein (TIGR03803 family)
VLGLLVATATLASAQSSETVLYTFTGKKDGGNPYAGVIRDAQGNLYGTTHNGGDLSLCNGQGCGVVFEITNGRERVLHTFTGGADGLFPWAGVIRDSHGNLYGTAPGGGTGGAGVVYRISKAGEFTTLYSFTGGADGGGPVAGVILDPEGNLYGTTFNGGVNDNGVVYKLDPATKQESVLYSFQALTDGANPYAGVIRDSAGNLYGTTYYGGDPLNNVGVIYKVDTSLQESVLNTFYNNSVSGSPTAGVLRDGAGNIYGTVSDAVYKVTAANGATGELIPLYNFTGGADGGTVTSGLVRDAAGSMYGTANSGGSLNCPDGCGVVYKVFRANNTWQETVLYTFAGGADGASPAPYGALSRDSAGTLYGTTQYGGKYGAGVVFEVH